jgi:hypothetical protein
LLALANFAWERVITLTIVAFLTLDGTLRYISDDMWEDLLYLQVCHNIAGTSTAMEISSHNLIIFLESYDLGLS